MNERAMTRTTIQGGVSSAQVFDKICRLETFPDFMPDVRAVRILEQNEDSGLSEWEVDIDGCPLRWVERDEYDHVNHVFQFYTVEGDFDVFNGRWQVTQSESGEIDVSFSVEYCVGIPVIEDIIGPILRVKIENNISGMLAALKEELEAASSRKIESTVVRSAGTASGTGTR